MDRTRRCQLVISATLTLSLSTYSPKASGATRHWRETESETLWRGRYTNCDYAYYVSLPEGVVAHGTHSPNPNHGFLLSLPDFAKTSTISSDNERVIYVDASYDPWEDRSLKTADRQSSGIVEDSGSTLMRRRRTRLAGIPAISTMLERRSKVWAVDEELVAVRSEIVYTISLHTDVSNRVADEVLFHRIEAGFRLLPLPKGECSNGR